MNTVNIEYFAILRDQAKTEKEILETDCKTLGELYQFLKERYHFTLPIEIIQVALNDEFSTHDSNLSSGDKIVFIPPVAGG